MSKLHVVFTVGVLWFIWTFILAPFAALIWPFLPLRFLLLLCSPLALVLGYCSWKAGSEMNKQKQGRGQ